MQQQRGKQNIVDQTKSFKWWTARNALLEAEREAFLLFFPIVGLPYSTYHMLRSFFFPYWWSPKKPRYSKTTRQTQAIEKQSVPWSSKWMLEWANSNLGVAISFLNWGKNALKLRKGEREAKQLVCHLPQGSWFNRNKVQKSWRHIWRNHFVLAYCAETIQEGIRALFVWLIHLQVKAQFQIWLTVFSAFGNPARQFY